MESILLEVEPELMDADEAADLLLKWEVITPQDVQELELELSKANDQEAVELPRSAAMTLAIIELVQMAPPTASLH
jgi:hypothetical protein